MYFTVSGGSSMIRQKLKKNELIHIFFYNQSTYENITVYQNIFLLYYFAQHNNN